VTNPADMSCAGLSGRSALLNRARVATRRRHGGEEKLVPFFTPLKYYIYINNKFFFKKSSVLIGVFSPLELKMAFLRHFFQL
jgi:hypothetical protein